MDFYFYDIPVYRLPKDEYANQRRKHIETRVQRSDVRLGNKPTPSSADPKCNLRIHLEESYGGIWNYNEIVGFIRLHFCGAQIRGEYFATVPERKVRTRKRIFEFKSWKLAPEETISLDAESNEIYEVVLDYLSKCREELPQRHLDLELFQAIGPYLNWKQMLEDSLNRSFGR